MDSAKSDIAFFKRINDWINSAWINIFKMLKHSYWSCYYWIYSQKNSDGVEYIWKRRHSERLIIVFNSMSGKYNFMRSLQCIKIDQLFIHDCWADNASYYWYEKKQNYPEIYTLRLIEYVLSKGKYKEIITLGGSKGGTAAIYYGLKINANLVFAGACQYNVGAYLARHQAAMHPEQWEKVVGGKPTQEWIDILDHKLEGMIESCRNCNTLIKLIYSTEEHTYPEHIVYLIEKLDECNIKHEDRVETFTNHSMNGVYVKKELLDYFHQ